MAEKKSSALIIVLVAVIAAAVAGAGVWWFVSTSGDVSGKSSMGFQGFSKSEKKFQVALI